MGLNPYFCDIFAYGDGDYPFHKPKRTTIDGRTILGYILFGERGVVEGSRGSGPNSKKAGTARQRFPATKD